MVIWSVPNHGFMSEVLAAASGTNGVLGETRGPSCRPTGAGTVVWASNILINLTTLSAKIITII